MNKESAEMQCFISKHCHWFGGFKKKKHIRTLRTASHLVPSRGPSNVKDSAS